MGGERREPLSLRSAGAKRPSAVDRLANAGARRRRGPKGDAQILLYSLAGMKEGRYAGQIVVNKQSRSPLVVKRITTVIDTVGVFRDTLSGMSVYRVTLKAAQSEPERNHGTPGTVAWRDAGADG